MVKYVVLLMIFAVHIEN